MSVSVFQLFSIGIGPSSSHTVGPMRAARLFAMGLARKGMLVDVAGLTVELFGSLAMTGKGHATDKAVVLGLQGNTPEGIDPDDVDNQIELVKSTDLIGLLGEHTVPFSMDEDMIFHKGKRLPYHSNAIRFRAFDEHGKELFAQIFYSTGGGFVIDHEQTSLKCTSNEEDILYPYKTCEELLEHCRVNDMMIYDLVLENEKNWREEEEIYQGIFRIWNVMQDCVKRGCEQEGILPGGLNVKRRAPALYRELKKNGDLFEDPSQIFDWVSLFALAVNEENAAGSRVVTAPTNGAAGIVPSVLHYYQNFTSNPTKEGIIRFFLTATAIGILFKEGASLAGAEMGCQGEVGVACSMAAAGLTAALGGTNEQIENAAEIGMEHNLGLTCDPIAGLVQIPCIERNTMGAIKAINASRLALHGDGTHIVSLDHVIMAMRQTGEDMKQIYKETSEGGLALFVPVSVPEC
ncbi:MAG TPA: L-serine ammonia-lyase [Rhabdochlamydiaceae bacterium]|nr:L-serine ammonia-lyase [Rhabdochlamydiaceae bacterium]